MRANEKKATRLCPICGQRITVQEMTTKDGRLIGSCGDAFWSSKAVQARIRELEGTMVSGDDATAHELARLRRFYLHLRNTNQE